MRLADPPREPTEVLPTYLAPRSLGRVPAVLMFPSAAEACLNGLLLRDYRYILFSSLRVGATYNSFQVRSV